MSTIRMTGATGDDDLRSNCHAVLRVFLKESPNPLVFDPILGGQLDNTTFDVSRFLSALVERPTDIRRLIDFMLGASPAASRIDPERIGFFGFSLAAIPASPSSAPTLIGPPPPNIASNGITRSRAASRYAGGNSRRSPLSTTRGSRPPCSPNRSAFSFPPTAWWALKRRSSYGHPNMAAGVDARKHRRCGPEPAGKARIPRRTQCRHFAFVLCPPAFAKAAPEFCKDAPGFDRAPFHNRSMRICSRSSVRI